MKQKWLVVFFLVMFPPLGIYMLWQGEHFVPKTRWIITIISALWLCLHLLDAALAPTGGAYGGCAATFDENGCTYYRDDDCRVIARSCD